MDILKQESLRYLGYRRNTADEATVQMVDECLGLLESTVSPKSIYQILPVSLPNDNTVLFEHLHIASRNLAKNLRNCNSIVLFAATLGAEADRLLAKLAVTNMAKAAVMQASAAAYIEEYCDTIQTEIETELMKKKIHLRPRFSPGYGDFDISHQKDILGLLKTPKTIGLSVTDSFMLTPTKSVTAIMGISDENEACNKKGCEVCSQRDCIYRRGVYIE